ncbi:MAG: hypothetical protein K6E27_12305 [Eubacterium sp.]|nr:hypothetical protein [Eubacterium sp.]
MNILNVKELEFNNKKTCGLWLILVGSVLGLSLIFGGKFIANPIIFLAGYYTSFYIANVNKKIRAKLSDGPASPFQIKIVFASIALLFILMFIIAGPFNPKWNWKMIWLGVSLATGLHFFPFYFVHGRSMIILGVVCTMLSIGGYVFTSIPTVSFLAADSLVKLCFGIWMLFFSNPTHS